MVVEVNDCVINVTVSVMYRLGILYYFTLHYIALYNYMYYYITLDCIISYYITLYYTLPSSCACIL